MAEASWLVAPRHVPAQTDPVESCQQYAVQNPQITMGPINNHLVSSYFISGPELSRTKLPWNIYKGFFSCPAYLNSVNFFFSFYKMQECVIVLIIRHVPVCLYSILWAACVQNTLHWAHGGTAMKSEYVSVISTPGNMIEAQIFCCQLQARNILFMYLHFWNCIWNGRYVK